MSRPRKRARRAAEADDDADADARPPGEPDDGEAVAQGRGRGPWLPVRSLVVGGAPAGPGQFPHQAGMVVLLAAPGPGLGVAVSRCGAVLLSDRWLITAAHCCRRGTSVRVFLGSHPTMKDAQQRADSALVLIHPLYTATKPGHNDLALIRLNKPVRLNERVRPVRLPAWRHRADDFAGKVATLSGWGKTSDLDPRPSLGTAVLRFAKEQILSAEQAEAVLERKLPPYFICARGLDGQVSCNGDSGGPLTVPGADGRPVLVGVVSHRYSKTCSASKAHVCTRITSFLPWIASVTRVPVEH